MKPFVRIDAPAAPLDLSNVDTDRLVPARFLRALRSAGYGGYLFHDLRFDAAGAPRPEFVLNQPPFQGAQVLVAADAFGTGSSREGAVWALVDSGFHAVVASSFGDIFQENSFKNGLLTIQLPPTQLAALRGAVHALPGKHTVVDLQAQEITAPDGKRYAFEIDAFRKECLLKGQDEIDLTLALQADIDAYESRRRQDTPWLA